MTALPPTTLADALATVRAAIAEAATAAGRAASSITLIAVSKTQARPALAAALAAGQRDFGENRVQEAEAKWPELKARHPDCRLHLVGPLQTNKLKAALGLFDAIHTLDRPRLADKLAEHQAAGHALPPLFIQVNTGQEPQKAGILPGEADAFIETCRGRGLPVTGLMCIPPLDEPPALHFAWLATCARRHGLPHLSMGMSGDFATAIAMGATHVRIGTAIFGARPG